MSIINRHAECAISQKEGVGSGKHVEYNAADDVEHSLLLDVEGFLNSILCQCKDVIHVEHLLRCHYSLAIVHYLEYFLAESCQNHSEWV